MAANPNIIPQLKLALNDKSVPISKPNETPLNQRIHNLLREIFEAHEEFLGYTPD
jgi:hypothetical protein